MVAITLNLKRCMHCDSRMLSPDDDGSVVCNLCSRVHVFEKELGWKVFVPTLGSFAVKRERDRSYQPRRADRKFGHD